jgi:hypothetical protein
LSAVPLYEVEYTDQDEELRRKDTSGQKEWWRTWYSDGGIGSNFPIHFFDSALPTRPTFGLDLWPLESTRDEVYLPEKNNAGWRDRWNRFEGKGLVGFLGALINAIHAWSDNLQARAPGFRDRVVHVGLSGREGGLNLNMSQDLIVSLGARGGRAGELLRERFAERHTGWSPWRNHRWIRQRVLLSQLDRLVRHYAGAVGRDPVYSDFLAKPGDVQSKPLKGDQLASARAVDAALRGLAPGLDKAEPPLTADEPRPETLLRIVPKE